MGVTIIRQMVDTSPGSWGGAARKTVATSCQTVRDIRTVEVVKSTAGVEDGETPRTGVQLRIGTNMRAAEPRSETTNGA